MTASVVGTGADTAGTTSATTYPWPAGYSPVAGDVAFLFAETNTTTGLSMSAAMAAAGWAHITNSPRAQGSNVVSLNVFWKRLAGGEAAPQLAAAVNHQVGFTRVYRDVVGSGDPWDFAPVGSGNASGADMSATGGTTTVDDCLVIIASACQTDTASDNYASLDNGTLSDEAIGNQAFTTDGNGGGVMVAEGTKATAGATGTTTATVTTAGGTANLVFALKPATGATVDGTAAGTQAGTGSATGVRTVNGSSSGTQAGAATASGARTVNGTAAGVGAGTGSAVATRTVHGTAAGTQAGTGSATGSVSSGSGTVDGTASGAQAGSGSAVGTRTVNATASGSQAGAAGATTLRLVNGTGTGAQAGTAAAVGLRVVNGTATGTGAGAGTAVGEAIGDHLPADPSRTILVRHESRTLTVDDPSRTLLVRVEPRTLTA